MTVFKNISQTQNVRWIDARFDLKDPKWGEKAYQEGHIEGAVFWDLEKDLSDMEATGGRHPMPSKEKLTRLIEKSGLDPKDEVVIYDQGGAPYAARAWWLLKYAGFENAFISKKGFEALKKEGFKTTQEIPGTPAAQVELSFDDSVYADQSYVKQIINGDELGILLDARSAERYAGISEPIDPVAGRIPGARNFDWEQLVDHRGEFTEEVDFSNVLQKNEPAVVYCGSGVTAAALYAMLAHKGYTSLRLYAGSFSDWITDEKNVVEIDANEQTAPMGDAAKGILAKLIEEGYSGEMLMKKFEYEKSLLEKK
ncbi:3-mercaptopyruvate sulfurtransferase [Planococcus massiliensis]|uniref:3-mercaptopyruvate sulfurtransferase n=1 Tax=Planococcus massiliensis TaxID=1499687 RepID=A0A098EMX5_9BACL|nr:sulfurtransferase [Planococcus massiliensis]CEG22651.1 3-mercaptopyruvate sulfurtransferase [Planococcus massiliensis]